MELQVATAVEAERSAPPGELTFTWLYQQVQGYSAQVIHPKASRLERGAFCLAIVAAALGLLVARLSPQPIPAAWALLILITCLIVEAGGILVTLVLLTRREWKQFAQPRLLHAAEMDGEFSHWLSIVAQLRHFPRRQREARLHFVSNLRHGINDRAGLMYGSLQKLGIFPVLIALYLQFRNWEWGDWAGAFDVNAITGFLMVAMVLLYALGWMLIGLRVRLDTYVNLLEASLREDSLHAPDSPQHAH